MTYFLQLVVSGIVVGSIYALSALGRSVAAHLRVMAGV